MASVNFKVGSGVTAQSSSIFTTATFSGAITSTVTGAAPFVIASGATKVTNLYSDKADTLATARAIYGNNFDGSAALTQIIASTYGGTGNGFTKFSGATTSEKTYTLPNSNATLLYDGGALGTPSSATLTNATGLPLGTGVTGTLPVANGGTGTGTAGITAFNNITGYTASGATGTTSTNLVFSTSPTFTTSIDGGATFAAFASSSSLTIGYSSTGASTTNISTGAVANATTKTINIGTGGAAGSVTNVNIGSSSATANSSTTTMYTKLIVKGDLQIDGTTTTVNSTTVTVDDPIFVVGGDTAPASDDNLDRGIEFRWHNGTSAKLGFFGFDDSTGYFTFVPDATDSAGVISGSTGTFDGAITGQAGSVANAITFNTTGGAASGTTYNGSAARTIDYSTVGAAASSHTHGNITNAGKIGTTGSLVVTTGSDGTLTALAAGTTSQWLRGDGTFTAVTLGNSQTIKFDTGTTEGTDLYTFNGSASKTIDIKAGTNITLTKTSGSITISAASTGFSNPMTTLGDIIYGGASGTATRLAGNATTTKKFLTGTGDGSNAAAPTWDTVTKSDVGLSNVENTALSTWTGSTSLVTVGEITIDSGAKMDYVATTINANTATAVHSGFAVATYRSAKYHVQLTQGTKYRVSEVLVIHDGTASTDTEYGIIEVGGTMSGVTVNSTISGGNIVLQATVTDGGSTSVAAKVLGKAIVI